MTVADGVDLDECWRPARWRARIVAPPGPSIATLTGFVVALAAVDIVANVLVPTAARVPIKLLLSIVAVLWARRVVDLSWREMGLDRTRAGRGARIGLIVFSLVAMIVLLGAALPATREWFESDVVAADSALSNVLDPLVVIPLGTVVFEELLFRAVLLGLLLRSTTVGVAIAWQSVLFGLWHTVPALHDSDAHGLGSQLGVAAATIAVTALAGVAFAWLRLYGRSLATPVLAHLATNSVAYVAALIALEMR